MKQNDREELKGMKIPPAILIREILRGWRIILLAALVFAGIFAGYRYLRYVRQSRAEAVEDTLTEEVFRKAAAITEEKIETRKEYLAGSILAGINPYKMAYAETSVFLSGDREAVDKVRHSMIFFITNKLDWTEFSVEHGIEEPYLRELVSIGDGYEDNSFIIRIRHRSEEEASEMMTYLEKELNAFDAELQETAGVHTYELMDWQTRTGNDTVYADWAEAQFNRIPTLEPVLETFKKKAASGKGAAASLSKSALLKYMILGGAVGTLFAVLILLALMFARDRLLDAGEIKALYGIKNLAVFPPKKAGKNFVLDRLIDSIGRDRADRIPEEERLRIAGEKLLAFAPDAGRFALLGDVEEKELQRLAELLGQHIPGAVFTAAPAPERKADSVRILREADAVILVGETDASRLKVSERQIDLAGELGKAIAGSIVL